MKVLLSSILKYAGIWFTVFLAWFMCYATTILHKFGYSALIGWVPLIFTLFALDLVRQNSRLEKRIEALEKKAPTSLSPKPEWKL